MDWQETITWVIASLGGNAVLLAAAAWLIKALVSNRLALESEKFKLEMKFNVDLEIERIKAFLNRATHVHEQQVDILGKLYSNLLKAEGYLQLMGSAGSYEGEASPEDYGRTCAEAIASARDTIFDGRLLVPPEIVEQCDQFFGALFEGQRDLALARHPMVVDGLQRAEYWDKAQKIAREKIPIIRQQIEKASRNLIHGEATR